MEEATTMTHLTRPWLVGGLLLGGLVSLAQGGETLLPEGAILRLDLAAKLPDEAATCVSFAPDGKTVLVAGSKSGLHLRDLDTGRLRQSLPTTRPVRQVVFSADGVCLAALQEDGGIVVCNRKQGQLKDVAAGASLRPATTLAFPPTGSTLLYGDEAGGVYFWDTQQQKLLRGISTSSDEAVSLIRYTCGGAFLQIANRAGHVERREPGTGKLLGSSSTQEINYRVLDLSPSGRLLVIPGLSHEVRIRELASGQELELIPKRDAFVNAVRFSPDGRLLALGVASDVQLWSLVSGKEIKCFRGHKRTITSLAFAPDGKTLASASKDGTALLWTVPAEPAPPAVALKAAEVEALWQELGSGDSPKAYRAMRRLAGAGTQALPLLKQQLQPLPAEEQKRLRTMLRQLDDDEFERREQATAALKQRGERILPAVQRLLSESRSEEVQRRVEQVVEGWQSRADSAEQLRWQRALILLEWLKTPESRKLLQTLADGPVEDLLTHEARSALRR